jgi:hypothetical protein
MEIDPHILHRYAQIFLPRFDLYSLQVADGSYMAFKWPLTMGLVEGHLKGRVTLGAYMLSPDNTTRKMALDADDEGEWQGLVALHTLLQTQHIPTYLERSRRGGHVWFFFSEALPGVEVRRFGKQLQAEHGLEVVELYPKQNELRTGPGSLVRLPLGIHRKDGKRYGFVTPQETPLAPSVRAQMAILSDPETIPATFIHELLQRAPALATPAATLRFEKRSQVPGATPSEKIKNAVSVLAFVSEYVQLARGNRGLCPFHDDHKESFSVNEEGNYWHCFSGCGGGSIIDFWMKWKQVSFTEAVTELAGMLLPPLP